MKRRVGEGTRSALDRQTDKSFSGPMYGVVDGTMQTLRWLYHRVGHWALFALAGYLFYQAGEISLIQIGIVGCGLIMRHTALMQTEMGIIRVLLSEQMIQAADPERAKDEFEPNFVP